MQNEILTSKLKQMSLGELQALCDSLRQQIMDAVTVCGGHLSSNLGMVELTVALHYVFDLPADKLIFDVGHQCYAHKLLTGRAKDFVNLRKYGGISGFPKREESPFDCYNTGHAGTSISAALGIAKARDIKGENFNVIAVIGDGSFNNGLIYEAFNSLKPLNTNILIILNDNGMSISPTVGSMHEYLEVLAADAEETSHKNRREQIFGRFGFEYDGVYDGNDLKEMIDRLSEIKNRLQKQSIILHVLTKKGKGYSFCEENPEATHGVSKLTKETKAVEYSEILGKKLIELADKDERVFAVTAAMTGALGLNEFFNRFPRRSVDVGICEENATVLCAAMATEGLKPYYAVYSTFLQRSFDEIVIDICSQNLPVTLCIDRAGVTGADGETHQGVFDLSYLNLIPNITIAVPKDIDEFSAMLDFSLAFNAPLAIRYPRESKRCFGTTDPIVNCNWEKLQSGGGKYAILACGERALTKAFEASEILAKQNLHVTIINARFVKPLDKAMLNSLTEQCIITVEDNVMIGGFGASIAHYFCNSQKAVKNFAFKDTFIPHGGIEQLFTLNGITAENIVHFILENEN